MSTFIARLFTNSYTHTCKTARVWFVVVYVAHTYACSICPLQTEAPCKGPRMGRNKHKREDRTMCVRWNSGCCDVCIHPETYSATIPA